MSYVRCVRGLASGIEYSADAPLNLDPAEGRPVEMVLDLEPPGVRAAARAVVSQVPQFAPKTREI